MSGDDANNDGTSGGRGNQRSVAPTNDLPLMTESEFEAEVARAYLAMVHMGQPTRAKLEGEGIEPSTLRYLTRVLEDRGFVTPTGPDTWAVNPPEQAMSAWANSVERRAQESRVLAASLQAMWESGRAPTMSGEHGVVWLDTVADVVRSMHELVRSATQQVWAVHDTSPASLALFDLALEAPGPLAASGVKVRMLVDRGLLERPGVLNLLERRVEEGYEVRLASKLIFSAISVDTRAMVVDLTAHDPDSPGSFEMRRPTPVAAVRKWAKVLFEYGTPLSPALVPVRETRSRGLSPRDQRILSMLATGLSDQVIARHCGCSTRTVERRVRWLSDRLGASSRFQAGAEAVRRGWL